MTQRTATLPKDIRYICNRITHERSRLAAWDEGTKLRRLALQRLMAGEDVQSITQWLKEELARVLVEQA